MSYIDSGTAQYLDSNVNCNCGGPRALVCETRLSNAMSTLGLPGKISNMEETPRQLRTEFPSRTSRTIMTSNRKNVKSRSPRSPIEPGMGLISGELIDAMEKEQDAIVLKLMKEINILKEENSLLKAQISSDLKSSSSTATNRRFSTLGTEELDWMYKTNKRHNRRLSSSSAARLENYKLEPPLTNISAKPKTPPTFVPRDKTLETNMNFLLHKLGNLNSNNY